MQRVQRTALGLRAHGFARGDRLAIHLHRCVDEAVLLLAARFGVPVCPHAGGLGLCEYVQHLSVIDYVCVSGSLADRTTEFANHLHEHFVDPARIRNGRYLLPEMPGYPADLTPSALEELTYPTGRAWR